MGFRVGIDWGGTRHAVCVVDAAHGTIAAQFEVAHTAAGLAELRRRGIVTLTCPGGAAPGWARITG